MGRLALSGTTTDLPVSVSDGLRLRLATASDSEALAQFNVRTMARDPRDAMALAAYARGLLSPEHPTCGPANFTIVEDTRSGSIVSSMCIIPQIWTYAGIPFGVGRMELVSTDPAYRRRGLVRLQFEYWHARSTALGHWVQAITGIPWYYRQFGYEYALDLDSGRTGYLCDIAPLAPGESESYRLRPIDLSDVPFAMALYEAEAARSLVAAARPGPHWTYFIAGCPRDSPEAVPFQIIESAAGERVGYVVPHPELEGGMLRVSEFVVIPGQSIRKLAPSVLRALKLKAEAEAAAQHTPVDKVYFMLGQEHPLYAAIPEFLTRTRIPYGWYIRVAAVPGFMRLIASELEERLTRSPLAGHTGELKISEYKSGFRLAFENGRLTQAEAWEPMPNEADARIPPLVFLQLLFGFRSLEALRAAFPDCRIKDGAVALLETLFPQRASDVHAIG